MKFVGKLNQRVKGAQFPNLSDLLAREFRLSVALAALHCAMDTLVVGILFACAPFKIVQSVIKGVSVEVATFFSYGAWTSECFKNKGVNLCVKLPDIVFYKNNTFVKYRIRSSRSRSYRMSFPFYPAMIFVVSTTDYFSNCINRISFKARTKNKTFRQWWNNNFFHGDNCIMVSL